MKILVACEESQAVTAALLAHDPCHDVTSCDLLPTRGDYPHLHYTGDALDLLPEAWDMIIAFPPCTHLASSGARWFKEKRKDGRQQSAIDFFMKFVEHTAHVPRVAIENPVGIMSNVYRKPDQIVHPWWFGDGYTKATCFWLKNLPLLEKTTVSSGRSDRIHKMPGGKSQARARSVTPSGLARAIASQWG